MQDIPTKYRDPCLDPYHALDIQQSNEYTTQELNNYRSHHEYRCKRFDLLRSSEPSNR